MLDISQHPLKKRYDIDSAFSTIWEYYKKWFITLFSISFVATIITNLLASKIDLSVLQETTDPALMMEALKPFVSQYLIIALFSVLFTIILQYYVIVKPIDSEGNLIGWISRALVRFLLPVIIVYIVFAIFAMLALALGLILLIIGVFFAMFYVLIFFLLITPVMLIEETTILSTFSRVLSLGHKKFWIALGWTAIFTVLILIVSLVFSSIIMIPFSGGAIRSILNPDAANDLIEFTRNPIYIVLAAATGALTMPLQSLFALVLYFNLRSYEDDNIEFTSGSDNSGRVTIDDLTP